MFQPFQGGLYVEVFTPGAKIDGKEYISFWKFTGCSKERVFDSDLKSHVICLDGDIAKTKMESKVPLTLVQRFLVFQLLIPTGGEFCVDLSFKDIQNGRRRLTLSSSSHVRKKSPGHAGHSIALIKRQTWLNLCIDLSSLVSGTWDGQTFKSLETISLAGSCLLRRIFTMKAQLPDTTDDEELYDFSGTNDNTELDSLPRMFVLGRDVASLTQVINMKKIVHFERRSVKTTAADHTNLDVDSNNTGRHKQTGEEQSQVVFGSRVNSAACQASTASREASASASSTRARSARREKVVPLRNHKEKGQNGIKQPVGESARTNGDVASCSDVDGSEHNAPSGALPKHGSDDKRGRRRHERRHRNERETTAARIQQSTTASSSAQIGDGDYRSVHVASGDVSSRGSSAQTTTTSTASRDSSANVADVSSRESSAQSYHDGGRATRLNDVSSRESSAQSYHDGGRATRHNDVSSRESSAQSYHDGGRATRHNHVSSATRHDKSKHARSKSEMVKHSHIKAFHPAVNVAHDAGSARQQQQRAHARAKTESDTETKRKPASSRAIGHADATTTAADRESSAASAGGDSDHMTYVHPHPPAEPMSSQRRQRRVRSAGKQRTPADGHLNSNHPDERGDAPRHQHDPAQPAYQHPSVFMQVANDSEVDDIMTAMRRSYDRSVNKKYDSTTSDENSHSREERDELQFVLDAMRYQQQQATRRSDDTSDTTTGGAHEYEQSDDDDVARPKRNSNQMFSYESRPNAVPYSTKTSSAQAHKQRTRSRDRYSGRSSSEQRSKRRNGAATTKGTTATFDKTDNSIMIDSLGHPVGKSADKTDKPPAPRAVSDKIRPKKPHAQPTRRRWAADGGGAAQRDPLSAASSEEEPQMSVSQHRPRPRSSPRQKHHQLKADTNQNQLRRDAQGDHRRRDTRSENGQRNMGSDPRSAQTGNVSHQNHGRSPYANTSYRPANLHLDSNGDTDTALTVDTDDDRFGTWTRHTDPLSISRQSLREVPGPTDDVRQSGGSRPYDPSHYQVADLSDSAERRLLIDIQSDDRSDDDDDASSGSSHSSLDSTKKNTAEFRGDGGSGGRVMHHYRRSSPDSADETISGTLSSHRNRRAYDYGPEINMGRSLDKDHLYSSNPRTWTTAMSPVLPTLPTVNDVPNNQVHLSVRQAGAATHNQQQHRMAGHSLTSHAGAPLQPPPQQEEMLDLLYDSVSDSFYDPNTGKYYRLL